VQHINPLTHNLKVVGSNLAPATKLTCFSKCLSAALRGGVCVYNICGSTVEAKMREIPHIAAKIQVSRLLCSAKLTRFRTEEGDRLLHCVETGDITRTTWLTSTTLSPVSGKSASPLPADPTLVVSRLRVG
jgi:hypothetical protein